MKSNELKEVQGSLLNWFDENQRHLPWRKRYEPYQVWISEIMLQQTQVQTMLPYYHRWMERLPRLQDVAEASEDLLIKLWEGLGYYRRVHNIKKTAVIICRDYGGTFPGSYQQQIQLPGIGPYTAGAIASIAFNVSEPVLDGNMIRVISRMMNNQEEPRLAKTRKRLWQLAREWIPEGEARRFNQAMMEIGALICLPSNPKCLLCPMNNHCRALQKGTVSLIPLKPPKKKVKILYRGCAVILFQDGLILCKRNQPGLLEGLWEFPSVELGKGDNLRKALEEHLLEELGKPFQLGKEIHTLEHRYTSFRTRVSFFTATVHVLPESRQKRVRFVKTSEVEDYGMPAPYRRFLKWYLDSGMQKENRN